MKIGRKKIIYLCFTVMFQMILILGKSIQAIDMSSPRSHLWPWDLDNHLAP